jgi:hypothetical protein
MDTDFLKNLAEGYLTKLREGKLDAAEQFMAATVFEKLFQVLEKTGS